MARKVFISVLGASIYQKCTYAYNGKVSSPTHFIQKATLMMHEAQQWPKDSAAYILLTQEARRDNWIVADNKRKNFKGETIDYMGLKDSLSELALPFEVIPVDIPRGDNDQEIWQIFDTVYHLLQDGDELYFDLTHGFRYLPMLVLVLGNYAKFLNGAEVKAITYGNWEGRNPQTQVAPIANLLPLSSLQDWTFAAANYLKNGYSDRLKDLSKKELLPFMRNKETRTADMEEIIRLMNNLQDTSLERITCRGMNVIEATNAVSLANRLERLDNVVIQALSPVINKLREAANIGTQKDEVKNIFDIARWCYDHHLYQQAVTYLEEGIISVYCSRHGIDIDDSKKRDIVTSAFTIKGENIEPAKQKVKEEYRALLNQILGDETLSDRQLVDSITHLIDFRNDFNHCGFRNHKPPLTAQNIEKTTGKLIEKIIGRIPHSQKEATPQITKPKIFVNLSNHLSKEWGLQQLEEAKKYGEIVDLPFPTVNPEDHSIDIDNQALEISRTIHDMALTSDITVHVMGEMTLTYSIVSKLKASGIKCIASTTSRKVMMEGNKKISTFEFVKFREY